MNKIITCNMTDCIYNQDKGEKEGVNRFQCSNDETEIDASTNNTPTCYTYEDGKPDDNE